VDATAASGAGKRRRKGAIGLLLSGLALANLTGAAAGQGGLPLRVGCGDLNGYFAVEPGDVPLGEAGASACRPRRGPRSTG
jgi:hypothetical protein